MPARRSILVLAFALAALAAIGGVVKLVSGHREARVEDAFQMLAAGAERLGTGDTAAALEHFQASADRFRTVGRDPLMALHHALAAKLRSANPDLREVRQLALPGFQSGEALLELAWSRDSTLLAVATSRRLLCLAAAGERWIEWELPRPVERVGALYVESRDGKVHAVIGDDGTLLTADCRASGAPAHAAGSPLIVAASATDNRPAIAWLDAEDQMAWIAPTSATGAEVKIVMQPLPGSKGEPAHLQVAFPGEANALFPEAAVVHAIGKIEDNVLLFYGDSRQLSDSDLRDESVLVFSADEPERRTNRLVFAALADEDEKGKVLWRSTRVTRMLPASAPGRVYAMTEVPPSVVVLGSDAKQVDAHADSLFSTEYADGEERYDLIVKSSGKTAVMELNRRQTGGRRAGSRFSYELPWRFEREPGFAAISADGRRVAVAHKAGGILLIDLTRAPAS